MIVYGSSLSPFVRKVLAFAAEMGIGLEVQVQPVRDKSADFMQASPFGKMPALRDGDFTLCDSSAIIHYIDTIRPGSELIPREPRARGRVIWYEEFADTILIPTAAKSFFNRIVAPRFLGHAGDLEAAERAEREEMPPLFDFLEGQIPDGLHLVENRLTLADIAVASPFPNLAHVGLELDSARYPRLKAFVHSMLTRDSFSEWVKKEVKILQMTA